MKTKQNKRTFSHYNTIIPLGGCLTTSKLALLHSSRRRQETTKGQHNEALVMCTISPNKPKLSLTHYSINHISSPQLKLAQFFVLAQMLYPDGLQ